MLKKIISYLVVWKSVIVLIAFLATLYIPFRSEFMISEETGRESFPYLMTIWGNFDGFHYLEIARRGYQTWEQPFFPLYPLVIKLVSTLTSLPWIFSAQLISIVSVVLSLLIMMKLLVIDNKEYLKNTFLLIIFLFPTAFFYSAVYNDSLFLLLATSSLYFARKHKWFYASILAALATLTRLNGLALLFPLFYEYLLSFKKEQKSSWDFGELFSSLKKNITSVWPVPLLSFSIIPGAFFGYLFYVHQTMGNWNMVFTTMKIWNQSTTTFPLRVFWRYLKILTTVPSSQFIFWVALFELLFVLLYVFIIIYSWKKIRFSYWIFLTISILIPSLTGTFAGMPRYALHLYPFFLAMALMISKFSLPKKVIYFMISVAIAIFMISFFTRGYFVS